MFKREVLSPLFKRKDIICNYIKYILALSLVYLSFIDQIAFYLFLLSFFLLLPQYVFNDH